MRIFISTQDLTGSNKTTRINISNCADTTELIRLVCKELNINKNAFIFLIKNEIINLRILEGWPLQIYGVKNGSWVIIKPNQSGVSKQEFCESTASLQKIEQNCEQMQQQLSNLSIQSPPQLSFFTNRSQENYQTYFDKELEKMLSFVRENKLDRMAVLLKQEPEIEDQKLREEIFQKKNYYILNEVGECGRNALHWAIHNQNIQILTFLLIKSADLTILTIDQYTPLQLAVVHRNIDFATILLNQPKIDVDAVTDHGTALHLAVYHGCTAIVQTLIDRGASIDQLDKEGKRPEQLSKTEEITSIFDDHKKKLKLRFIKPNITKGKVLKVSSITWRGKQRDIMANAFRDELTVFKNSQEVDYKIKISAIKAVEKVTEKSWLMDSKLNYFKIVYAASNTDQKLILALKNLPILLRWIQSIELAKVYVTNQKYVTKIDSEMQLIELLDDEKNEIKVHKRQFQHKRIDFSGSKKYSILDMKVSEDTQEEKKPIKSVASKIHEYSEVHFEVQDDPQRSFHTSENLVNDLRQSEILIGSILMQKNFEVDSTASTRNTVSSTCFGKHNFFESSQSFPLSQKLGSFRKKSLDRIQVSQFKPAEPNKISFESFDFIKLLGSGAFGQVYLTKRRFTQKVYAMKVLSKKKLLAKKQLKYAISETSILKKMSHPFVVGLFCSFQTPSNLYLALDYCPHGDLSQVLSAKERFTELTARFIIAQVILAIEYIHKQKIIYRDLKPENILIDKDGYIKLTDFGLSKEHHFATSFCGSPAYLSPQMLDKKGHSFSTDIYGIGCILYEMVVGEPPYYDENIDQMFENIRNARLKFPGYLTKQIRSLLGKMLQRDVSKRIGNSTMNEVKKHQFFNGFSWEKIAKKEMRVPKQMLPESIQNDYFKLENKNQKLNYIDHDYVDNSMLNKIKGFSFTREELD